MSGLASAGKRMRTLRERIVAMIAEARLETSAIGLTPARAAALREAALTRLRPVVMTGVTTAAGATPLILAT